MTYKGAIKQLYEMRDNTLMPEFFKPYFDKIIETLTADVRENVRGEWIYWYEEIENDTCTEYIPHCKCSECGTEYDSHTVKFINFCPNCGAKMGGNYDLQSYTGIY